MNTKKLAIVGKGTAGCISALSFSSRLPLEIDLYFDPDAPEQAVGEGSTLYFPKFLAETYNFLYPDLEKGFEGTSKKGIRKINYNGTEDFLHSFPIGSSGMHFNATKFQQFTLDHLKTKINFKPQKITSYSEIDANHIIDCSGKPLDYQDFTNLSSIPVNSTHIVQCKWEKPEFDYTLTIARPYGWVFGIPLQNRCSIGYLYNKNINTLEEVQEDIKEVFKQFNLTPSKKTKSFSFNNYCKKENFTDRVTYNGNASFFLEPLEATSIDTIFHVCNLSYNAMVGNLSKEEANFNYHSFIRNTEQMIAMHYFAGSKFQTPFWKNAYNLSLKSMDSLTSDSKFRNIFRNIEEHESNPTIRFGNDNFGTWGPFSFQQNIHNLGIYKKLKELIQKNDNPNLML